MLVYGMLTKEGDREYNEDFVGAVENGGRSCFVVADGLGGHEKGEVASRTVGKSMLEGFRSVQSVEQALLGTLFDTAQKELLAKQEAEGKEMLTTANLLCFDGQLVWGGHVGDSRTYVFQNGKVLHRTLDHSVPQMLVSAGEMKESAIRNHPDRNRLLRVMGTEWSRPPYVLTEGMATQSGQAFLLCTDGFWELILERQMQSTLKKSHDPDEWLQRMEEIVRKNGRKKNMDNYSAIAIWVKE